MSATPLVSVVIAARNSAATIDACLGALRQQIYPHLEVIVVDDGSDDDTAARAEAGGARVVRTPPVGASAARNLGLEVARGDIAAFTDGDCVAAPGWASALVETLHATGAVGVGGRQVNRFPPATQRLRDGFEAFFRVASVVSDYTRGDDRARPVQHNASCCSAYRIDALRAIGGFTVGLWPGEDVDLDLRLAAQGGRLYYTPDAVVEHHRPGTFAWFRRMMRRYGAAERRLLRRHGRTRRISHVPTVTAAGALLQGLLLVPAARPVVLAIDGAVLLIGVATLAFTTPVRLWPTVVAFGLTAIWEWHLGWLTAPRETP